LSAQLPQSNRPYTTGRQRSPDCSSQSCFDYLGVGDAARAIAVYVDNLRLMDAMSGEEITHIPLDEPFRVCFGNPYAVIHRGDLHGIFLEACRPPQLLVHLVPVGTVHNRP
jgi:2-polyprenyl-6-methoxyphenol hydroxylase-like FAD-dependent oxidoreductase